MARLKKYIFLYIGSTSITELKTRDYVSLLKRFEAVGHLETAKRVGQICDQVTRYARIIGLLGYDTVGGIAGAARKTRAVHHPAIIDPGEFGRLMAAIAE